MTRAIVSAAKQNPQYDPAWQPAIEEIARRYVAHTLVHERDVGLGERAKQAITSGCRDPFVHYVWLRWRSDFIAADRPMFNDAYATTRDLFDNDYPDFVRAYAAGHALRLWFGMEKTAQSAETDQLIDFAWMSTLDATKNPMIPESIARDLAGDLMDKYNRDSRREQIEARIEAFVAARFGRDCATLHLFSAHRAIIRAWAARGDGYAHTVTAEGWVVFERELQIARKELIRAWELDPSEITAAEGMITVCMGLGLPRPEMEEWFRRGLIAGHNRSALCSHKLRYLQPRWHGTLRDEMAFAQECLGHPEWGHAVPLTLLLLHEDRANLSHRPLDYIVQPEVWADMKHSLIAYLKVVPDDQPRRLVLAYYAWIAKDWAVLKEQLALVEPNVWFQPGWVGEEKPESILVRMKAEAALH